MNPITEYFARLRIDPNLRLGLGDIRLSIGMQEEVAALWEGRSRDPITGVAMQLVDKHNPANLTDEQVGVAEGWRLLGEDEIDPEFDNAEPHTCQSWLERVIKWSGLGYSGGCPDLTYRTKLTRAELRAARNQPPESPASATDGPVCPVCKGTGWILLPDNESRECECKFVDPPTPPPAPEPIETPETIAFAAKCLKAGLPIEFEGPIKYKMKDLEQRLTAALAERDAKEQELLQLTSILVNSHRLRVKAEQFEAALRNTIAKINSQCVPDWIHELCRDALSTPADNGLLDAVVNGLDEFRDSVLNQRANLESPCLDNDQTNAVLSLFDDILGPAKDALTGKPQS